MLADFDERMAACTVRYDRDGKVADLRIRPAPDEGR